jgi:hypothetical protein
MQATLFDLGRGAANGESTLRALTICQPWAWAIATGIKRVENRTWSTRYRGRLAIHAGVSSLWWERGRQRLEEWGYSVPQDVPRGAIVALCDLVGVVPYRSPGNGSAVEGEPFAAGPFCWLLANASPLAEPIPCRGQQGVFTLPREIAERIP